MITPPPPPNVTNNVPYLIAIMFTTLLGVVGVVAVLILRPHEDNAALFVAIGGFVAPTTAALLAFLKTQETHLIANVLATETKETAAQISEKVEAAAAKVKEALVEQRLQTQVIPPGSVINMDVRKMDVKELSIPADKPKEDK